MNVSRWLSNVFSFMNDHSYFLVKEEGDSNEYNSTNIPVPLLEGCYSFLSNGPLDSFSYGSLCSMSVFASILLWYVTIVWGFLIHQDSLISAALIFFLRYCQFHRKCVHSSPVCSSRVFIPHCNMKQTREIITQTNIG